MVTIVGLEKKKVVDGKELIFRILKGTLEVEYQRQLVNLILQQGNHLFPAHSMKFWQNLSLVSHCQWRLKESKLMSMNSLYLGTKKKIKLNHSYRYSAEPTTITEVVG